MSLMGLSILIVLLFAVCVAFDAYRQEEYQRKRDRLLLERKAHNFTDLQALLADPPSWIGFSDIEKCRWLNDTLIQLWPYAKKATEIAIEQALGTVFKENCPSFLSQLSLRTCDMGAKPPLVTGVNLITGDDRFYLDLSIKMSGDTNIVIACSTRISPDILIKLRNLEVIGTLRVEFWPLCNQMPCFKALAIAFTNKPTINFALAFMKVPIMSIPGLSDSIENLIKDNVAASCVWPRKHSIELLELTPAEKEEYFDVSPKGILRIKLVEASDLKNVDRLGTSDPYCTLTLGTSKRRSKTINNNLDPKWGETFEFLVTDPTSQNLVLVIKDDGPGINKSLGQVRIAMSQLEAEEKTTFMLPLEEGKGKVVLVVWYMPFKTRAPGMNIDPDWYSAASVWSKSALMVRVVKFNNLRHQSKGTRFLLDLNGTTKRGEEVQGSSPYVQQSFSFLTKRLDADVLTLSLAGAKGPMLKLDVVKDILPYGSEGVTKEYQLGNGPASVTLALSLKNVTLSEAPHKNMQQQQQTAAKDSPLRPENEEEEKFKRMAKTTPFPDGFMGVFKKNLPTFFAVWLAARFFGFGPTSFLVTCLGTVWFCYNALERNKARLLRAKGLLFNRHTIFDREMHDETSLRETLQLLPAWIRYPDMEKCEWLNEMVAALWPHLRVAANELLRQNLKDALEGSKKGDKPHEVQQEEKKSTSLWALQLSSFDLGEVTPLFSGTRHYDHHQQGEQIILDMEIVLAGDTKLQIDMIAGPLRIPIRVEDVSLTGTLRLVLKPLVPAYPCFQAMSISFVQPPKVDCSVNLGVLPLMSIPGLSTYVDAMLCQVLSSHLVWPICISVPILEEDDKMKMMLRHSTQPPGCGILRIHVRGARDLLNVDRFSKSDPYCRIILHDQALPNETTGAVSYRTQHINNNLNPDWNERFEYIVNEPSESYVLFTVLDHEVIATDRVLGEATLDLKDLPPDQVVTCSLNLDRGQLPRRKQKGTLMVDVEWNPFEPTTNIRAAAIPDWSSAVLFCTVHSAANLVHGVNPYVTAAVGGYQHRTESTIGTDPLFLETFRFKVANPAVQEIRLVVKDSNVGRDNVLGNLDIKISDVLQSNGLQDRWSLQNAVRGDLNLDLKIRTAKKMPPFLNKTLEQCQQERQESEDKARAEAARQQAEELKTASNAAATAAGQPVPMLTVTDSDEFQDPSASPASTPRGAHTPVVLSRPGKLTCTVHSCAQLTHANVNGYSDPYVSVTVESIKHKTKVVKRALNPEFEETFTFTVLDPTSAVLDIHVKDHDLFSRNQLLGNLTLPLCQLPASAVGSVLLTNVPTPYLNKYKLDSSERGVVLLSLSFQELTDSDLTGLKKRHGSIFRFRGKGTPDRKLKVAPAGDVTLSTATSLSSLQIEGRHYENLV